MNRGRACRIRLGFLLAVILLAWALALVRLGERSFWADEGHTAYLAQQTNARNLVETLRQLNRPHTSGWNWTLIDSPLHTFLMIGVVRLSSSEMVIRFPSAMAATLALPVLYLLRCRLFGRTAGLGGVFLLAISPFALGYAQEARTYALLEFLACLCDAIFPFLRLVCSGCGGQPGTPVLFPGLRSFELSLGFFRDMVAVSCLWANPTGSS